MSKKKTGLGTSAFFQEAESDPATTVPEPTTPPQSVPKPAKIRTTVTLYPETLAQLDMLKIHARQQGKKATYSDILREAIEEMIEKKGIRSQL